MGGCIDVYIYTYTHISVHVYTYISIYFLSLLCFAGGSSPLRRLEPLRATLGLYWVRRRGTTQDPVTNPNWQVGHHTEHLPAA